MEKQDFVEALKVFVDIKVTGETLGDWNILQIGKLFLRLISP